MRIYHSVLHIRRILSKGKKNTLLNFLIPKAIQFIFSFYIEKKYTMHLALKVASKVHFLIVRSYCCFHVFREVWKRLSHKQYMKDLHRGSRLAQLFTCCPIFKPLLKFQLPSTLISQPTYGYGYCMQTLASKNQIKWMFRPIQNFKQKSSQADTLCI